MQWSPLNPLKILRRLTMKMLGVLGSPRVRGNTDVLMDRALAGTKDAGADVEKVILNWLKINPCRDCDS